MLICDGLPCSDDRLSLFFFFFQTFTVNGRLSTQSVVLFYGYILATEWA